MARPRKNRYICTFPKIMEFRPFGDYAETIDFTFDEYETIRLIDYKGFSQEECSRQMDVARSTVALIYDSARQKIADAIINGKALGIHGGDVHLCPHHSVCCGNCGKGNCDSCDNLSCTKNKKSQSKPLIR